MVVTEPVHHPEMSPLKAVVGNMKLSGRETQTVSCLDATQPRGRGASETKMRNDMSAITALLEG
eukprot:2856249-Rhodomonas_salina.3